MFFSRFAEVHVFICGFLESNPKKTLKKNAISRHYGPLLRTHWCTIGLTRANLVNFDALQVSGTTSWVLYLWYGKPCFCIMMSCKRKCFDDSHKRCTSTPCIHTSAVLSIHRTSPSAPSHIVNISLDKEHLTARGGDALTKITYS